MLVLALFVFLAGVTLFNVGGSVSSSGTGDVLEAPAPTRNTASLTVMRVQPMTIIAGNGFRSGEVVRFSGVNTKQVRASAGGTFTLRFRSANPCNGFSVTAVGNKGSRTSVNYSQLLCAAP